MESDRHDPAEAPLRVRVATEAEARFVHELSARVQDELVRIGSRQEFGPIPISVVEAACRLRHVRVAEHLEEPVGGVFVEPLDARSAAAWRIPAAGSRFLSKLMIEPQRRGRGWGSAIVRSVQGEARASAERLVLDCWAGNAKLRRLYERLGFELRDEFPAADYRIAVYVWE